MVPQSVTLMFYVRLLLGPDVGGQVGPFGYDLMDVAGALAFIH